MWNLLRRRFKIIIVVLLANTIVLVGFVVWAETPPAPMAEAYEALKSDSAVNVSTKDWIIFQSVIPNKNIGSLFILVEWLISGPILRWLTGLLRKDILL